MNLSDNLCINKELLFLEDNSPEDTNIESHVPDNRYLTTNISSNEIYYFTNTKLETSYSTLWSGYIYFKKIDNTPIRLEDVDNILVDICNINFYIKIDILHIYISMDQDEKYYHHQFEKHIKKIINKFEEMFNITVINGIFNATELKHQGNQYRYRISKKIDNKILVSKKVLNWEVIEKKNKKSELDDNFNDILKNFDKITV